jgi:hypothetical protein
MQNCNTDAYIIYDAGNDRWVDGVWRTQKQALDIARRYVEREEKDEIEDVDLFVYHITHGKTVPIERFKAELKGVVLTSIPYKMK